MFRKSMFLVLASLPVMGALSSAAALPGLGSQPNSSCAYIGSGSGTLFSWGVNFDGELGDCTTTSSTNPVIVFQANGVNGWRAVAAGFGHAIAIGDNHQLYSWGANHAGQLGYGCTTFYDEYLTPAPVPVPAGVTGWQAVAAENSSSLALSDAGEIYGWGLNSQGNLGIGTKLFQTTVMFPVVRPAGVSAWSMIAAGQSHGLAMAQDGLLFAWGAGGYGQLGTGSKTNAYAPVMVSLPSGVTSWTRVCAGQFHSLALGNNGELYGWGRNNSGQLGIGNTNDQLSPVHISRPIGVTNWLAVAAGAYHSLALDGGGNLYAWGNNYNGQIGPWIPTSVPPPPGASGWTAIGATASRSLALDQNCRLYRWGGEGNGLAGSDSPSFTITSPALINQLDALCVTSTNLSPSVSMVAPTNGSTFAAPATILLQASANDADGTVTQVRFYSSGFLLGTVTNPPFQITLTNVAAGYYSFTAAATDNAAASVMSAPQIVLVNDNRYFNARINFQPAGTDVPTGCYADTGQTFGNRGNGLSYGWNADNSTNMIKRNSAVSPDPRYDTFAYLQRGGNFSWEIAVPNGFYQVHFVRGDAWAEPHFFQTTVENWLIGDSGAYDWDDDWIDMLQVQDGRLSVTNYFSTNNKLCFIEVQGVDTPPTLSIVATDGSASEGIRPNNTTNCAQVTVTRVGATTAALWVLYDISGTASNGVDFFQVYEGIPDVPWTGSRGGFYIPAGQSSVAIDIVPLENNVVEPDKTATFTLEWSEFYNLAAGQSAATVTISNNDFLATGPSPVLALIKPAAAGEYIIPTNILLQAQATSGAGLIQRVDFLLNGTNLLGTATNSPYDFLWTNVPSGFSTLTARALNSTRASIYTLPVEIMVLGPEPPRPALLGPEPLSSSSYLIDTNGMVFSWGANSVGQLGIGGTIDATQVMSVPFPAGVTGWNEVAGGSSFALAVSSGGRVYSWGQNSSGQLGLGNTNNQLAPLLVPFSANITAWHVAAGSTHSLLLDSFGRLYSWGSNAYGQLGNGTTNAQMLPQPVSLPSGVTSWSAIAAGDGFSLAIGNNGNVYAWGRNNLGQLGNTTITNSAVPIRVAITNNSGWKTIAAGGFHAMALSHGGQLFSWGLDLYGELGYITTNTFQSSASSVPIPAGVSAWQGMALGQRFSLALASDGSLYAWGNNSLGGLGTALPSQSIITNPTPVIFPAGVTRWLAFTAGRQHCLAIGDDGNLYSWGSGNAIGQPEFYVSAPTQVIAPIANLSFIRTVPEIQLPATREGKFQFRLAGVGAGYNCIEWSTNLIHWVPVMTNSSRDSYFTAPVTRPASFYRVHAVAGQ